MQLREFSGEEVLRGDEFKRYINNLRTKSSIYKMKRAELNDLRAEFGILSRTHEILKAKEAQISEQLVSKPRKQIFKCVLIILIFAFNLTQIVVMNRIREMFNVTFGKGG